MPHANLPAHDQTPDRPHDQAPDQAPDQAHAAPGRPGRRGADDSGLRAGHGRTPMPDGMRGGMQAGMAGHGGGHMSYARFAAMIATSTVVMYGLMFSTALQLDHVWFSQTRFWMATYMGATMAVIMLAFMLTMYADRRKNAAIFGGATLVFAGALILARSQRTVGDVAWMKGMIPHHSIAILTSERARITDPRVRKLADDIIAAQRREIGEMEGLIADLERRPAPTRAP